MKYRVNIARLRIEVAEVEIEAPDDDAGRTTAEAMAKLTADSLAELEWEDCSSFDAAYEPWVVSSVSEADVAEDDMTLDEHSYETEPLGNKRYLLLEGDIRDASGRLITQPWYPVDNPGLIEADLATDWVSDLQAIGAMKRL